VIVLAKIKGERMKKRKLPKKLTLNKAWELCLEMWKDIAKTAGEAKIFDVEEFKLQWMEEHFIDYRPHDINHQCFFCQYDKDGNCENCPGVLIEPCFDCMTTDYNYEYKPIKFYKKLQQLNRKRLKAKENEK
jgi:hypothetical protein